MFADDHLFYVNLSWCFDNVFIIFWNNWQPISNSWSLFIYKRKKIVSLDIISVDTQIINILQENKSSAESGFMIKLHWVWSASCRDQQVLDVSGLQCVSGELKVQQCEVLSDGDAVFIAQEVAPHSNDEGFSREAEEGPDPFCCHLDELHLWARCWETQLLILILMIMVIISIIIFL